MSSTASVSRAWGRHGVGGTSQSRASQPKPAGPASHHLNPSLQCFGPHAVGTQEEESRDGDQTPRNDSDNKKAELLRVPCVPGQDDEKSFCLLTMGSLRFYPQTLGLHRD